MFRTANPAQFCWKWTRLALLFSRKILNGSHHSYFGLSWRDCDKNMNSSKIFTINLFRLNGQKKPTPVFSLNAALHPTTIDRHLFLAYQCNYIKKLQHTTSQREFDYGVLKKHGPAELFSATFFCTCLLSIDLFCRTSSSWPRLWSKQFPAASYISHGLE